MCANLVDGAARPEPRNGIEGGHVEPNEIFELIIKADERVKYSNEANMEQRKQQAIGLLTQARDAAREAGNEQLVQQAETRLMDLGATP